MSIGRNKQSYVFFLKSPILFFIRFGSNNILITGLWINKFVIDIHDAQKLSTYFMKRHYLILLH